MGGGTINEAVVVILAELAGAGVLLHAEPNLRKWYAKTSARFLPSRKSVAWTSAGVHIICAVLDW